jgi:hypothetical protein
MINGEGKRSTCAPAASRFCSGCAARIQNLSASLRNVCTPSLRTCESVMKIE